MHIIIIGAGTGGLALGHALQKANANITFTIYERDRTRKDGLYGYRVGISPDGSRSLAACLPPDLFEVFKCTTAITPGYFNMFTEQFTELLSISGFSESSPQGTGAEYSVSRMTLRQLLLTGLEDAVEFDKAFTHYTLNSDGTVTANFKDGTRAVGDALVGADGTNSLVRRQYLPHAILKETGLYGATAKLPLIEETRKLLIPKVLRGVNMFVAPHGDSCILHVMEFPWDHTGNLKNDIGSNDQELIKRWPGLNFDNTRDYIMLGFSSHGRRLPNNFMSLDGPSLHALLLNRTSSWHPDLRKLFELSEPNTCFPLNIRTTERLQPWKSSAVTLIGDAIHTMTPGLGVGSNTALLDAQILATAFALSAEKDLSVITAVAKYERQMHTYAWDRVEKSLERFNADDAIYKPGLRGGLALMLMRVGMRVVNALPPIKRKMAAAMTAERGQSD